MAQPMIIACAITGAEISKKNFPNLPVTVDEQVKAAEEAVLAGASIIHLHVRDDKGEPTQNVERFEEVISKIRERVPGVIIQISTGGALGDSLKDRLAPLQLQPEMASLNMGSLNFGNNVFINSPQDILKVAEEIYKNAIMPELELYEIGHLEKAAKLFKKEILKKPLSLQFVLGVDGGMSGDLRNFVHALILMEFHFGSQIQWSVAGIGRYQLNLATYAILLGGNVRVGLEDNIYYKKGELAESNAQLVERVVRIAKELGREVATPEQAREILGIKI